MCTYRLMEEFRIVGEIEKGDSVSQYHVVSTIQDQEYSIQLFPVR